MRAHHLTIRPFIPLALALALGLVLVLGVFPPAAMAGLQKITEISPAEVKIGDVVTFRGENLYPEGIVVFHGAEATIVSWSNELVQVRVPDGAWGPGCNIYWPDGSSLYCWDPLVKPSISSITPDSGKVGDVVTIQGGGFGPEDAREYRDLVQFWASGQSASVPVRDYLSWTTNQIRFRVPDASLAVYNVWVSKEYSYFADSNWVSFNLTTVSPPPPPSGETSRTWGSCSIGVPQATETWYLAEGSTGPGFETWVLVQNPNSDPVNVDVTFMTPSGLVQGPKEQIPGNSRKSYNEANYVKDTWEVSAKVAGDKPVIVERSEYGNSRQWGHNSVGATATSQTWYLAEGSTAPGYQTYILVQNPNNEPAQVTLTYMTPGGAVNGPIETLPANSRKNFEVAETVSNTWEVSTKVTSDKGIIAERAMYNTERTWATDSVGVADPSLTWYLGEGSTGSGFETWVLVQNPNSEPANIDVTFMTPSGAVQGPKEQIPANSRKSYNEASFVNNTWEVSTKVTSDRPVITERAEYASDHKWAHDSIGTTAPSQTWFLAEGSTGIGFETWVLVQNPNAEPATVNVTYITPSGLITGPSETLPANSRKNFEVFSTVQHVDEVSTIITSSKPVVAERAMYGDAK